jgi:penicillin amidase
MLAGDDQGHIGWTIAGPMPERQPAGTPWRTLLAPADHPHILDPASGQLQTANSRQLIGAGSAAIGDGGFDLGARTRQIRDDVQALGSAVDVKAAYGVVLDDRALFLEGWRQRALAVLDDTAVAGYPQRAEFKRLLTSSWDNEASVSSVGYRLARGFLYALYDECFVSLNDSLGKLDEGASYRLANHRWPVVIETLLTQKPAAWLPAGRKDWRDVQLAAIDKTIANLTEGGAALADASWGERNRANIANIFAKFLPLLRPYLSAPADMLAGDSSMPRVAAPSFGPSERLTVAPGKEEEGIFNMPGGESGHPLSPFYLAGHEDWVKARPAPLLPGAPKYGLVLTPG